MLLGARSEPRVIAETRGAAPTAHERGAESAVVFDIQRFSVHDGPGIRTLVFLKGCPLHCAWCSNPESQEERPEFALFPERCLGCKRCIAACPHGAAWVDERGPGVDRALCQACGACARACPSRARVLMGRSMTVDEVFDEVAKDAVFYSASGGGITIGGGEVTVWPEFAAALLARCREAGFGTAIETCGHTSWRRLWKVASLADEVLYDVKHFDAARQERFVGAGTATSQRNLAALVGRHQAVIVRVPVIPGFNDDADTIREIAQRLRKLDLARPIELLPYHRLGMPKYARLGKEYSLGHLQPPEAVALERLAETVRGEGLECRIGG